MRGLSLESLSTPAPDTRDRDVMRRQVRLIAANVAAARITKGRPMSADDIEHERRLIRMAYGSPPTSPLLDMLEYDGAMKTAEAAVIGRLERAEFLTLPVLPPRKD